MRPVTWDASSVKQSCRADSNVLGASLANDMVKVGGRDLKQLFQHLQTHVRVWKIILYSRHRKNMSDKWCINLQWVFADEDLQEMCPSSSSQWQPKCPTLSIIDCRYWLQKYCLLIKRLTWGKTVNINDFRCSITRRRLHNRWFAICVLTLEPANVAIVATSRTSARKAFIWAAFPKLQNV